MGTEIGLGSSLSELFVASLKQMPFTMEMYDAIHTYPLVSVVVAFSIGIWIGAITDWTEVKNELVNFLTVLWALIKSPPGSRNRHYDSENNDEVTGGIAKKDEVSGGIAKKE